MTTIATYEECAAHTKPWGRIKHALRLLLIGSLSLGIGTPSLAASEDVAETSQDAEEPSSIQTYPRSYFDRFNPQTSIDLLERLPGFTLDTGDDLRGFGNTAGNVLIDGERPSAKSFGFLDALSRIPANQVERIEVIRGSAGSSEAAGQAVVANIIRREGITAGSWEAGLERAADGTYNPTGEFTLARGFGAWETSSNLYAAWERYPLAGPRIQRDGNGELILSQREQRPSLLTEVFLSSEAARDVLGGDFTLTTRAGWSGFYSDTERLGFDGRFPDGSPDDRLTIDFDSEFSLAELGMDWDRPLGDDWSLKLLSFSNYEDLRQVQNVFEDRPVGTLIGGSRFERERQQLETLTRTTVSRTGEVRFRPEFGVELVYNRVDSALELQTEDLGIVEIIDLPAANVLVEEFRGEAFANLIWQASNKLSFETGVAAEASEISVSGDADSTQTFTFFKPFATLIYDAKPGLQFRLGGRRSVGQLDFDDFAASASAADDRLLAGNPNLGPDQTTRLAMTTDIRSEGRGALNVEFFHEWRDDVIEQVQLPSGSFGAANAGSGRVWGVTANTALPLSRFIPGALVEAEADFRDSSFDDPLTGTERGLSNVTSPTVLVELRQDLTERKVAWGVVYDAISEETFFFADEESFTRDGARWTVFVETTRWKGIRSNLEVRNLGERNFFRERTFFEPDRSGLTSGTETISRDRGTFIKLTLSGQF